MMPAQVQPQLLSVDHLARIDRAWGRAAATILLYGVVVFTALAAGTAANLVLEEPADPAQRSGAVE